MKKRSLTVLMIMTVIAAMIFTACGQAKPTLESYMDEHPEIKTQISDTLAGTEAESIVIEFKGNDLIFTYDLANVAGMTEEVAKSDEMKQKAEDLLESQSENFKGTCNSVLASVRDDGTEIENVNMIVNYTYGEELIATKTYESDPVS